MIHETFHHPTFHQLQPSPRKTFEKKKHTSQDSHWYPLQTRATCSTSHLLPLPPPSRAPRASSPSNASMTKPYHFDSKATPASALLEKNQVKQETEL